MEIDKVFVVYDPTHLDQPALTRAASVAAEIGCDVHVFVAIYQNAEKGADKSCEIRQLIAAQNRVLQDAVAPMVKRGTCVTTEVDWDKDWYGAVVRASIRSHADVVLKSSYRHSTRERVLNRTSDWTLIR
jgi:universal stress protein E